MKTTANALVSVFRFPRRPAAHSLPRPAVHRPNAPKGGAVPVFLALLLASAANVPAATTYPVNTPAGTWGATGTVVSTAGDTVVLTANQSSNATLTLTANVTAGHLDIGRADAAGPATNYTFALGAYSLAFDSGNGSPSVITHEANALADSIRGTGAAASALL
ncbi:MAG: hypothetical protein LBR12_02560, partial [Opitutaceae bacterium]|nr:hypothetical protein [Opitutaceae bacterium]